MEQPTILSYVGEEGMMGTMRKLIDTVKRITEFQVKDTIMVLWNQGAAAFEEGHEADAIKVGLDAHTALRNIFGAYLRNAAVPKKEGENQTARFKAEINRRDAEYYDEDIVAVLRMTFGVFEAAVLSDTNGDFNERIEAYLAVKKAISTADGQQGKLDNKCLANAVNFMVKDGIEPTRVQRRIAKLLAARKLEDERRKAAEAAKVQRKAVADDARAMFA